MRTAAIAGICILGALAASSCLAADKVWIWRYDGSLQCETGTARPLAVDQKAIEAAGAKVLAAKTRLVPKMIMALCGAPTGKANTFEIPASDWAKIKGKFQGPSGFELWTWPEK